MADAHLSSRVLGDPPTDLSLTAQSQWNQISQHEKRFRGIIRGSGVGREYIEEVLSTARVNFYRHLRSNGPVSDSPIAYFTMVCKNASYDHLKGLAKKVESLVADSRSLLEDPERGLYIARSSADLVEDAEELQRGLKILKDAFTSHELTVWVLAEAYDLDSPTIAEHTGSTAGAVRQTLKRARDKLKHPKVKRKLFGYTLATD
ncbi:sigma-70 family RNA polymerase sigma factor [Streptomyces cinereoruber]|uniref:sigma-70 family RNA polymerase sigma factor n=1 Tax=Streptomyces cinereoruber TaxID=67260 RepID=UPI003C2BC832